VYTPRIPTRVKMFTSVLVGSLLQGDSLPIALEQIGTVCIFCYTFNLWL